MSAASARNSLVFSALGHAYAHWFEPIFYIVALVLPAQMGMPYEDVLPLIVAGKLLYGVAAPLAGWLGDRWSTIGMMALFFLGVGASAVATGFARTPWEMGVGLAFVGLFGSIYHPVGIAWLVRNSLNRGKAMGINGIFGGAGPAVAGVMTTALLAWGGWRLAFILPGLVVMLTGIVFLVMISRGIVVEATIDRKPEPMASKGDTLRTFLILSVTMLAAGLIYQSTQPALPKLFEERLGDLGLFGIGAAVTLVYGLAGAFQVVSGHLADRFSLKSVYIAMYLLQVPLLLAAAKLAGLPLLAVAVLMVCFNMGGIPAENVLIARYTPPHWRGTAYGLKFILSFGVSGLGVPLVSYIRGSTGDFVWLFVLLALAAALVAAFGTLLPGERKPALAPQPAE